MGDLLIYEYQIPLVRMTHAVESCHLPVEQAQPLHAQPGKPAFSVDRLTHTEKNGHKYPGVWFQAVYREDNHNINPRFQAS